MKSIGKSVWVLFCVCVVHAGGRGEAASALGQVLPTSMPMSQTIAPGRVCAQWAYCAGTMVSSVFLLAVYYVHFFYAVGLFWLRRYKGFKELQFRKP